MHFSSTSLLLFQLFVILIAVKIFGKLFVKLKQPSVIGEIVAGIVLGPSVLGLISPSIFGFIFPENSLSILKQFSQIGLLLFMFIIGMEFNLDEIKSSFGKSVAVSFSSILIPFFLGCLLGYLIYENRGEVETSKLNFSLFIGISMSITAFPVLIRIMKERGILQSELGVFVTGVAALVDVIAWIMLATITTIVMGHSLQNSIYQIIGLIVFLFLSFLVVKPFLNKYFNQNELSPSSFSVIILVLLLFSFITDYLGIHALFGSFLAGIIMPNKEHLREKTTRKIAYLTTVVFLPLFFVVTGLRTKINLLNSPDLIGLFILTFAVAFGGKIFGTAIPAKLSGKSWKDSWQIGILMNTRGLMELVVLNLGFELGVLPESLFTILTIIAILSTILTSPFLYLIERYFQTSAKAIRS